MDQQKKFAVLIDADNVSPERFERIFGELTLWGDATYRRIYGNWAEYNRSALKEKLVEFALTPVQQFNYIKGKNATDIAMVIDAMDILYTGKVDGFAIVTNDSDFTRLALRLRESGMIVLGMGDDVAPASFRTACTEFIVLRESRRIAEELTEQKRLRLSARRPAHSAVLSVTGTGDNDAQPRTESVKDSRDGAHRNYAGKPAAADTTNAVEDDTSAASDAPASEHRVLSDRELREAIKQFLYVCEDDDGWLSASTLINRLKDKFPSLDIKDYADLPLFAGKRKIWTTYFLALGFCESMQKGPSNYSLRLKFEERRKMETNGTAPAKAAAAVHAETSAAAVKAPAAERNADKPAAERYADKPAADANSSASAPKAETQSSSRKRSRNKARSASAAVAAAGTAVNTAAVQAETVTEPAPQRTGTEGKAERKPEPKSESNAETRPEAKPETKPDAAPAETALNTAAPEKRSRRRRTARRSGETETAAPEAAATDKQSEVKPAAETTAPTVAAPAAAPETAETPKAPAKRTSSKTKAKTEAKAKTDAAPAAASKTDAQPAAKATAKRGRPRKTAENAGN